MHGSISSCETYVQALADQVLPEDVTVVLFPPTAYLAVLGQYLAAAGLDRVALGAQDLHAESAGAFTGETAGEMIGDVGARWTLVGHSERRQYAGETDAQVAAKFAAALRAELTPVLCVGETQDERDAGDARRVVQRQVAAVADVVGTEGLERGVVAYEPVWAIGTGRTASAQTAAEMHGAVRSQLAGIAPVLADVPVLYGGSVKSGNAAELFAEPDIDGGLVGGASLDAAELTRIVLAASGT